MINSPFYSAKALALFFVIIFQFQPVIAQTGADDLPMDLTEFMIYSGSESNGATTPSSPGYSTIIGPNAQLNGTVGAAALFQSQDGVKFNASIHAGGKIDMGQSNLVSGDLTAANADEISTNVLIVDAYSELFGDIHVNGNAFMSTVDGMVEGSVTIPEGFEFNGPAPLGSIFYTAPELPSLPIIPGASIFSSSSSVNVTESTSISPGSYGDMILQGNQVITFSEPGEYTFQSIQNSGKTNRFKFDFTDNAEGQFVLNVHDDAMLGKIVVDLLEGGTATQVLLEVQGNGFSSPSGHHACVIENGSNSPAYMSAWQGSIFTPNAGISIGEGIGESHHVGAFWAAGQVSVGQAVVIDYEAFPFEEDTECTTPSVTAGPDVVLPCVGTVALNGDVETGALPMWTALNNGNIFGQSGSMAIVDQAGTYVLTATVGSCMATDTVVVTEAQTFTVSAGEDLVMSCQDESLFQFGESVNTFPFSATIEYSWASENGEGIVSFDASSGGALFNQAGTFVVTATGTNGCTATDTLIVSFDESTASASAGPDINLMCESEVVSVVGSTSTVNASVTWTAIGNGFIVGDNNMLSAQAAGSGAYEFSVERNGQCVSTDTMEINPPSMVVSVDAGEDSPIFCYSSSIVLEEVTVTPPSTVTYSWEALNGGNISDGANSETPTVTSPGNYVVTINYGAGCSATDTVNVYLDAGQTIAQTYGDTATIECGEYLTIIDGFAFFPGTITWSTTDGSIVDCMEKGLPTSPPTPMNMLLGGGNYSFTCASSPGEYVLSFISENGLCAVTDTIQVIDGPQTVNAYAGEDTTFSCNTGYLELNGQETIGFSPYVEYEWSTDNGNIAFGQFSPQVYVDAPGDYTLTVYDDEGCSSSDVVHVDLVGPPLSVTAMDDTMFQFVCQQFIPLNAEVSNSSADLTWHAINGGFTQSFVNDYKEEQYFGLAQGQYIVTASVGSFCVAQDTVNIFTNPNFWSVDISPLSAELNCTDSVITLTGSTNYDEPLEAYGVNVSWQTSDGNFVTLPATNQFSVDIDAPGTYVFVFSEDECETIQAITVTENMSITIVDAGSPDAVSCSNPQTQLSPTTSATNPAYEWTAGPGAVIDLGPNTENPVVSGVGKYYLTVTDLDSGCSGMDSVEIFQAPCIIPYYEPLPDGKSFNILGSELTSLYDHYQVNGTDTISDIFKIFGDSVFIEVITFEGQTATALNMLTTSAVLGMTDFIPNGLNPRIITGKFPIANLPNLELDPIAPLINYVRPLFPALTSSGVAYTQGDVAQGSDYARNGFDIDGSGVKVCVLSDSYNTVLGSPATNNVAQGDLPGAGNAAYMTPVDIIQEYPFGQATDEGRAMLQIVHDIAPGAELGFRTGIVSEGDLAMGVIDCMDNGCDMIVDDVTFLTSPFYQDGVIAQAVDSVVGQGVSYMVAAGNFEDFSYAADFNPIPAPTGFIGSAHDFGGGDFLQSMTLSPGVYTFVLQWEDEIYSLGDPTGGTVNDFDIYLNNEFGTEYFGFNRDNLGGDPIEVMPFIVPEGGGSVQANIMITRAAGSQAAKFKFIAFRGDPLFNEFATGTSTIVGQANTESAITVGAVNFDQTPAFGIDPPVVSVFSSEGGSIVSGTLRNKPDIVAPNGGSTTVDLGAGDIDGDGLPDFYGTSAAAPHAAGAAALLIHATDEFYGQTLSPADLKELLMTTAQGMNSGGSWDFLAGAGLVQADSAMLSLAAPIPTLNSLIPELGAELGVSTFEVTVEGEFYTTQSVLVMDGVELPTTFVSGNALTASVPVFAGIPDVYVYNPPLTPALSDGGYSDTLNFGDLAEPLIEITANDEEKIFGESLPSFSSVVTLNGVEISSLGLSLADVGIASITYNSIADFNTNVDFYSIEPVYTLTDPSFENQFDYQTVNGLLSVDKMSLLITPKDTTMTYGAKVDGREFKFDYEFDEAIVPASELMAFKADIEAEHKLYMAKEVILVEDSIEIDGRQVVEQDFINLAFSASQRAVVSAGSKVSQRAVVSGGTTTYELDTTYVVDLSPASIFEYQLDSAEVDLFATGPLLNRERAAVSQRAVVSGSAKVSQRAVVSGSTVLNSASPSASGASDIVVVLDENDESAPANDTLFTFHSLNLITGLHVDSHLVVSAALLSANFEISNSVGDFVIEEAPLTLSPVDLSVFDGETPVFDYNLEGLKYDDSTQVIVTGTPVYQVFDHNNVLIAGPIYPVGEYSVQVSGLTLVSPSNYVLFIEDGTLSVTDAVVTVTADIITTDCGDPAPPMTYTVSGISSNDQNTSIAVNPTLTMDPAYDESASPCMPGAYTITASGLELAPADHPYLIEYVDGTLYVNPKGPGAQPISIGSECLEVLDSPVNGFNYMARIQYKNLNSVPVYIPVGPNNDMSSVGQSQWNPVEVFLPGIHDIEVYFDGDPLTWTVKSWDLLIFSADQVQMDQYNTTCNNIFFLDHLTTQSKNAAVPFGLFPNPAQDIVTLSPTELGVTIESVQVMDMMGRIQDIPQSNNYSGEMITLDFEQLQAGIYLVKIISPEQEYLLQLLKE